MAFRKVKVTTVVTLLAPYNPKRVCMTMINKAGSTAFIHTNKTEITAEGFPLAESSTMSFIKVDGDHPEEALYAQTETGDADIRVQESWE